MREVMKDQIKLLRSPGYDGQAKIKVCGPWDKESIEQAIDDWNDNVMFNALNNEDGNLDVMTGTSPMVYQLVIVLVGRRIW